MHNFRPISLVVSEIDAEIYRGAIVCIFLQAHDFSEILDGCKFCTVKKDSNFKFSGNALLLACCSAHRKEHLTVHYGYSGNIMKSSKNLSVSLQAPDFGILFCPFGFLLFGFLLIILYQQCTNTPYKYRIVLT